MTNESSLSLQVLKTAPPIVVHELFSLWLQLEDICRNLKTFSISGCKVTEKSLSVLLTDASESLTVFTCENCLTASDFGSILQTLVHSVEASLSSSFALQDFTMDHKGLMDMEAAVKYVSSWTPFIRKWESLVKCPLRLKVFETPGVENFSIQPLSSLNMGIDLITSVLEETDALLPKVADLA
eukprot:gene30921-38214_t